MGKKWSPAQRRRFNNSVKNRAAEAEVRQTLREAAAKAIAANDDTPRTEALSSTRGEPPINYQTELSRLQTEMLQREQDHSKYMADVARRIFTIAASMMAAGNGR